MIKFIKEVLERFEKENMNNEARYFSPLTREWWNGYIKGARDFCNVLIISIKDKFKIKEK